MEGSGEGEAVLELSGVRELSEISAAARVRVSVGISRDKDMFIVMNHGRGLSALGCIIWFREYISQRQASGTTTFCPKEPGYMMHDA